MSELTAIEHRLGALLRAGLSNKQIGAEVGYTPGYVRNRLVRMMAKTQTLNRVQLACVLERAEVEHAVLRLERNRAS